MHAVRETLRRWFDDRLRRWREAGEPLDPGAFAECLRELGLPEDEIATARRGSEADIRRMMTRFGLDPGIVPAAFLGALRDAERVCAHCLEVRRCHRFFRGEEPRDAARLFCPNAELFDRLAAHLRATASGDAPPDRAHGRTPPSSVRDTDRGVGGAGGRDGRSP